MNKELTEMVFILDASGSMSGQERDTVGGFNSLIKKQREKDGEALISTILFNNVSTVLHDRLPIQNVKSLTEDEYQTAGNTALLDAIGGAIHHIGNVHKYAKEEDRPAKTVIVVTTDGMENSSAKYDFDTIKAMVERQKKRFGWEFIFLGANVDSFAVAKSIGIDRDHASNYSQDTLGTELTFEAVNNFVCNLRENRTFDKDWKKDVEKDSKRTKKDR